MTTDLDQVLTRLREQPTDRRLDQLEPAVWTRIGTLRSAPLRGVWASVWGWRAALAAAMLAMGAFAGSIAAAKPATEVSPFAINSSLTPSTLLEGRS
jgi:hypothetical protein